MILRPSCSNSAYAYSRNPMIILRLSMWTILSCLWDKFPSSNKASSACACMNLKCLALVSGFSTVLLSRKMWQICDSHKSLLLQELELILRRMILLQQDVSEKRAEQGEIISLPGLRVPTTRIHSIHAMILMVLMALLSRMEAFSVSVIRNLYRAIVNHLVHTHVLLRSFSGR